MMEFDPIHDIIANNSPLMFVLGVLPATSPSSFVSPTPQFRDKELHPFLFFFFFSACMHIYAHSSVFYSDGLPTD
jgi:hypothetical protein